MIGLTGRPLAAGGGNLTGLKARLLEEASAGTLVTIIRGTPPGGIYSFPAASPWFQIDPTTGEVTTKADDVPIGVPSPRVRYEVTRGARSFRVEDDLEIDIVSAAAPVHGPSFTSAPILSIEGGNRVGNIVRLQSGDLKDAVDAGYILMSGTQSLGTIADGDRLPASADGRDVRAVQSATGAAGTQPVTAASNIVTIEARTVAISAAQAKVEGNSGTTSFTYTVTRTATLGAVGIAWSFAPGTTEAADFAGGAYPTGGAVALADGVATGTFTIEVAGDVGVEADELFTVSITVPPGYAAGTSMSATGTILNDDEEEEEPAEPSVQDDAVFYQDSFAVADGKLASSQSEDATTRSAAVAGWRYFGEPGTRWDDFEVKDGAITRVAANANESGTGYLTGSQRYTVSYTMKVAPTDSARLWLAPIIAKGNYYYALQLLARVSSNGVAVMPSRFGSDGGTIANVGTPQPFKAGDRLSFVIDVPANRMWLALNGQPFGDMAGYAIITSGSGLPAELAAGLSHNVQQPVPFNTPRVDDVTITTAADIFVMATVTGIRADANKMLKVSAYMPIAGATGAEMRVERADGGVVMDWQTPAGAALVGGMWQASVDGNAIISDGSQIRVIVRNIGGTVKVASARFTPAVEAPDIGLRSGMNEGDARYTAATTNLAKTFRLVGVQRHIPTNTYKGLQFLGPNAIFDQAAWDADPRNAGQSQLPRSASMAGVTDASWQIGGIAPVPDYEYTLAFLRDLPLPDDPLCHVYCEHEISFNPGWGLRPRGWPAQNNHPTFQVLAWDNAAGTGRILVKHVPGPTQHFYLDDVHVNLPAKGTQFLNFVDASLTPAERNTLCHPKHITYLQQMGGVEAWLRTMAGQPVNQAYFDSPDAEYYDSSYIYLDGRNPANISSAADMLWTDGAPIHFYIDMANRLGMDLWWSCPRWYKPASVKNQAGIIHALLATNLRRGAEWTNEAWQVGGSFLQGADQRRAMPPGREQWQQHIIESQDFWDDIDEVAPGAFTRIWCWNMLVLSQGNNSFGYLTWESPRGTKLINDLAAGAGRGLFGGGMYVGYGFTTFEGGDGRTLGNDLMDMATIRLAKTDPAAYRAAFFARLGQSYDAQRRPQLLAIGTAIARACVAEGLPITSVVQTLYEWAGQDSIINRFFAGGVQQAIDGDEELDTAVQAQFRIILRDAELGALTRRIMLDMDKLGIEAVFFASPAALPIVSSPPEQRGWPYGGFSGSDSAATALTQSPMKELLATTAELAPA